MGKIRYNDDAHRKKRDYMRAYYRKRPLETRYPYRKNGRSRHMRGIIKAELVALLGGRCVICGYDRHFAALHFDHIDPATKRGNVAHLIALGDRATATTEALKCRLLCANCHAETTWPVRV